MNSANAVWSWEDVLAKAIPPPLKRQHVLESPALVALIKARDAKEKKDLDVFHQLKTFKRDEGGTAVRNDSDANTSNVLVTDLKLPNLGNMSVGDLLMGTADHSVERTETANVTTPRIPSAAPAPGPAPTEMMAPSWGDYEEDLASTGLEDAEEPVLRTVSYKIRADIFVDDPRGRDVAIQEVRLCGARSERQTTNCVLTSQMPLLCDSLPSSSSQLLDDLSKFWTSTVKGFNFFGVQYKKEVRSGEDTYTGEEHQERSEEQESN